MIQEEEILRELKSKFIFLENRMRISRQRRIFLEVEYSNFPALFDYAVKVLGFSMLCAITGLDEGETLGFIYHLAKDSGITLNIKTALPKEKPLINSVINYFPCAEVYERELADLFGAQVEGMPAGNRYPLTDDWPENEFPMRKDWLSPQAQKGQVDKNA
ncbi:MAG: NADH-quinone oxidoreductase subunit C [Candidatus Omnitrophota bacterium]